MNDKKNQPQAGPDMSVEAVIAQLSEMRVGELAAFVKELERAWGVSALAPVVELRPPPPAPEATRKSVVLHGYTKSKASLLRALRSVDGSMSISQLRELLAALPATLQSGLPAAEAETMADTLREGGADVRLE